MDSFTPISTPTPGPLVPTDEEASSGKTFACVVARTDAAAGTPDNAESSGGKTFCCVVA